LREKRKPLVLSGMAAEIEFDAYLRSLSTHYDKWWQLYTLTDAQTKTQQEPSPFDFRLMVQTVKKERLSNPDNPEGQDKEKSERFPVLEGIRKYVAEHRQVLLVGRPGSGKSTTLARLLLEEARGALGTGDRDGQYLRLDVASGDPPNPLKKGELEADVFLGEFSNSFKKKEAEVDVPLFKGDLGGSRGLRDTTKIPALVELRFWSGSLIDRIQAFFQRHDLQLDRTQIEDLLFHQRLLLLMDGLNELPSEAARLDVAKFRQDYPKVSMIFTTRDLSLGGDFGLEKKLEMQPLTEAQMQAFVRDHLKEQAEAMLRQLKDRLREFGQTPLLLWMLCEVCKRSPDKQLPSNLGDVFRTFTKDYELNSVREHQVAVRKGDVQPLSDRDLWFPALKHLAAVMMNGETVVDFRRVIDKTEAEQELQKIFSKEPNSSKTARDCLKDLLKYHLLQNKTDDSIEFKHQLIQEYYAAEYLLSRLDQIEDFELKRDYLNYLKWTEPLALMLRLEKEPKRAIRLIKLALEVDLQLGARLVGEAQQEFHSQTINLLENLEIPAWFKLYLLGETKSFEAIEILNQALLGQDVSQSWFAVFALHKIETPEKIFKPLIEALKNPDVAVHGLATMMLREIVNEQLSDDLLSILCESLDSDLKRRVIAILVQIPSDTLFNTLQKIVHDSDQESALRERAITALRQIGNEQAVDPLQKLLKNIDLNIRASVVATLADIKHKSVVNPLMSVLDNRSENYNLRRTAAETLAEMRIPQAVELMQEILLDFTDNLELRQALPRQLVQCGNDKVVQSLLQVSGNRQEELWLRISSVDALGTIRNQQPVKILQKIVLDRDEDSTLRSRSAISLARINEDKTFEFLLNIIEDDNEDLEFRGQIIHSLEWLAADCSVINKLQKFLLDHSNPSELRRRAAYTLRHSNSQKTERVLIQVLKDDNSLVVSSAIHALKEIRSRASSSVLIELLKHDDFSVRQDAAYALGSISSTEAISELINLLHDENLAVRKASIFALTQIGGTEVADALIQVLPKLKDYDSLYQPVIHALEQGRSETVTEPLFQAFLAADSGYKPFVGEVLGKVANPALLPKLVPLIPEIKSDALEVISAIQNRCKYYNYDLTQITESSSTTEKPSSNSQSQVTNITNNDFRGANIGNLAENVYGTQQVTQIQPNPSQSPEPPQ
jgi:HEAT repeat protein/energy-coupling factor transporter ATP-binding protein EcfA2